LEFYLNYIFKKYLGICVNSVFVLLHGVVVGHVADVSGISAACKLRQHVTPNTSTTWPTTTQCNKPRADLKAISNHRESLKSLNVLEFISLHLSSEEGFINMLFAHEKRAGPTT
jgi:hypothetical protein